jgi:hypothetical protein
MTRYASGFAGETASMSGRLARTSGSSGGSMTRYASGSAGETASMSGRLARTSGSLVGR